MQTALTVRGATNGDYSFTVGVGDYLRRMGTSESAVPRPRRGTYHSYRSDSVKTPRLVVTRARRGRAPGYLFLNTGWSDERPRPDGVLIADDRGRPVWFMPRKPGLKVFDVGVQEYRGEPVLTYWQGSFAAGWGYGEYVVLDESYREIARIGAVGGNRADIHDMTITPEGTALVPSYGLVRRGSRQVLDGVIQEIDIATGRLLFEWHSLDHIALSESRDRPESGKPFDYFHLNSIEVGADGDLLISARNTCAVYEIDRETGAVNWRLGGEKSDFRMGRGTRFCRQHDARWAGGRRDDAVRQPRRPRARRRRVARPAPLGQPAAQARAAAARLPAPTAPRGGQQGQHATALQRQPARRLGRGPDDHRVHPPRPRRVRRALREG